MGLNGFKEVLVWQSICLKIGTFKVILATFSRHTGSRPETVNSVLYIGISLQKVEDIWTIIRVVLTPGRQP